MTATMRFRLFWYTMTTLTTEEVFRTAHDGWSGGPATAYACGALLVVGLCWAAVCDASCVERAERHRWLLKWVVIVSCLAALLIGERALEWLYRRLPSAMRRAALLR